MTDNQRVNKAIDIALDYGQIDGAHHKQWVIDQILRVLAGETYNTIITEYQDGEDGPETYEWNEGIGAMKLVQVDINGTRGLALTDAKGSRVTVARIYRSGRRWLRYTGAHGCAATVYRRQSTWSVNLWNGLRSTHEPCFTLLRSALAVARQHVGLAVAPCYRCGTDKATPEWLVAPVRCALLHRGHLLRLRASLTRTIRSGLSARRCRYDMLAKPQEIVATVEYR